MSCPDNSFVILLTGLSGAGKTTIAKALVAKLREQGGCPVLLDGDEIREIFKLKGFDEASRKEHNLNLGSLAALLESQCTQVVVSLIAPYAEVRAIMRVKCRRFIEVYISTPIETCIARDSKGLYAKAMRGEIKNFTGISAPYEVPTNPEIILDTTSLSVEDCVNSILKFL